MSSYCSGIQRVGHVIVLKITKYVVSCREYAILVISDAVKIILRHLEANPENKIVDFNYCKNVAVNLFYKVMHWFILHKANFFL